METLFQGIFDYDTTSVIAVSDFLLCLGSAVLIGLLLSVFYCVKTRYTKSFVVTLALLPAVVCVVIMMVNGNVGTGVAVAGAFSLVRFRSAPGSAKEICAIFIAMASGLIVGMGYIAYAFLNAFLISGIMCIYNLFDFILDRKSHRYRTLHITIPEDLDYTGVFDEILDEYTSHKELTQVRTTNMGSLFKLTYEITLKNLDDEKEMIDALRCRNGNLEITVSKQETVPGEL